MKWRLSTIRRRLRRDAKRVATIRLNASFVLWRRVHEELYSKPATDSTEDEQRLSHVVARRLCGLPPLDWVAEFADQHPDEIDRAARKVSELPVVTRITDLVVIANYWIAQYFAPLGDQISANQRRAIEEYQARRSNNPDIETPTEESLVRMGRQLATQVKEIQAEEHRRTALKFDIGMSELTQIIALISPLLVVAGFVYCHIYYGFFGIDTGLYFGLSDYLASSIEAIRAAGVSAAIAVLGAILSVHRHSASRPLKRPNGPGIEREDVPWAIVVVLLLTGEIESLWSGNAASWLILGALVYPAVIGVFTKYVPRLFVKPIPPLLISIFAGSLFSTLICSAEYNAHAASRAIRQETGSLRLTAQDGRDLTADAIVVGSNSNYFFLWNEKTDLATALPRNSAALIRVQAR